MSKALRETKCFSRSTRCAGQISPPVQRLTASSLPVVGIDLARGVAAAGRADIGKDESFRALRALLFNRSENLRDDIARPLHDHRVADPHVLARDLVLVMQRRVLHHDAADGDGIELGDGRQRAGAAHLDIDVAQDGGRLLGGKFVGERPARRARAKSQALLEVEAIDLVDDAVDVVAEAGATLLDLPVGFQHLLDAAGEPHQRIDRKAPRAQRLVEAPLGVGGQAIDVAPAISEEAQGPPRGDRWIELPDEPGGGVARIGEDLETLLRLLRC